MNKIKIDLNHPEFQQDLFTLQKDEQLALIKTLRKISNLSWDELYRDQGLKWEVIVAKTTATKNRLYSFRFSQKYRVIALREDSYLRLLTLHTDHDSAYK
ncbi:MAG: hypothetical protein EOP33_08020 [Rickettsiaceae bacterium]|nr:MAG: hypothetical protein EOP33_08020 [Rickettsiaceae bacterium]